MIKRIRKPPPRLAYVYVFLLMPLKRPFVMLALRLRLVERLLDDLLDVVFLEVVFDGVLVVLLEVDVFFLLLFNEPKSKLMIYLGGKLF